MVVSSMVGVGIVTTSGYTVAAVGSNRLMLVLWAVGGVVALCGAFSQAELSAAMPETGGDYVYLREAYGPLAAFLGGWVSFLLGFAAPMAATASAAASYLLSPIGPAWPWTELAHLGLSSAAIVALAAIHCSGRGGSARFQGVVSLLTLALLGSFAVAGLAVGRGRWANLADQPAWDRLQVGAMLSSLVYISYAYTGWNGASYLAGEVADPQRRLPRAILLGTGLVVALYLGLNAVYALALPAAEVRALVRRGGPDAVAPIAELAARRLFGPSVAARLAVAIGLVLLGSLSALVLTGPRVLVAMARAGQFPSVAGRLSGPGRVPGVATALLAATALALLWTGSYHRLIVFASVGLAAFSLLTIGAVVVLRRTRPDLPRPFRTPGYPITPAIYLGGTGLLTAAAFADPVHARPAALAVLGILAGVPLYYLQRSTVRREAG